MFLHRSMGFAMSFQSNVDPCSGDYEVTCWKLCKNDDPSGFNIGKKEHVVLKPGKAGPGSIRFECLSSCTWNLQSVLGFQAADAFIPCILTLTEVPLDGHRKPRQAHFIALMDWNRDSGLVYQISLYGTFCFTLFSVWEGRRR